MIPLSEIPINSICWFVGSITTFILGAKGITGYHRSHNQLSRYIAWFGFAFCVCQLIFSVPTFFTLDMHTIRSTYLAGEFFFYVGMVTQAAIVWCLILRPYFSVYFVTVPVAIMGFIAWTNSLAHAQISLAHNFITYLDPRITTVIVAIQAIGLFVPVGVYFIQAASKQFGFKAVISSFVLGLVYIGIGFSTGGEELLIGQIISPIAAIGNIVFFSIMIIALVLPHRVNVKLPAQAPAGAG